jgi:predicted nucleic acid-binding protein
MSERVLDANLFIRMLVKGEPLRHRAGQLVQESLAHDKVYVPPHFEVEVNSGIRRRVANGFLTVMEGEQAFRNGCVHYVEFANCADFRSWSRRM